MNVYTQNLYYELLVPLMKKYKRLKILSGYSSSSFLKKVINENPNISIELYIGMAQEGINKVDHEVYKSLSTEKIKIYYNVSDMLNHMKIYEFCDDAKCYSLVGSANFSENGFLFNEEILVQVTENLTSVFDQHKQNYLICTHDNIANYVHFYKKTTKLNREENLMLVSLNDLKDKIENRYFNRFSLKVVAQNNVDVNWAKDGINRFPFNGKPAVVKQPMSMNFFNYFPTDKEFIIYTYDGEKIYATLDGDFKREIHFKNFNFYNYLKSKLNIKSDKVISHEMLEMYNKETMYMVRLNENEYYMSFELDS